MSLQVNEYSWSCPLEQHIYIPPLADRSPSASGRQLYDFKTGARYGRNTGLMQLVYAKLTDLDIVDVAAYLAGLSQ